MKDRRNRIRRHIQAAQKWLGQAEHNLAEENDVRGNLNIMLASAELQQVHEKNFVAGGKRLAVRYVPPVVASLAAALIVLPHVPSYSPVTDETIATYDNKLPAPYADTPHIGNSNNINGSESFAHSAPPTSAEPPANAVTTADSDEPVAPATDFPSDVAHEKAIIDDYPAPAQPAAEKKIPATSAAGLPNNSPSVEPQPVKLPDSQMQKLMQSAGKVLRSE